MRRLRIPLGRAAFFLAALLFCLIALLPMRSALGLLGFGERGIAARSAEGAVWQGVLREARFGRMAAGDLSVGLRFLPLLFGQARMDFQSLNPATPLHGSISLSRRGFSLHDFTGLLPANGFGFATLKADDLSVAFTDGACRGAAGMVSATPSPSPGMPLSGTMSGPARCDRGALLLPLVGQSGLERVNLRIYPDGAYRADLILPAGDSALARPLIAAGFTPGANGYVRRFDGQF